MAKNLTSFITSIAQGVKPNMFEVNILWPEGISGVDKEQVNLLCKSAALPASSLGTIEVPFRGRTIKIAGDRTFDTWSATFFNDKNMNTRSYFEKWLEQMNTHEANNAPLFLLNESGSQAYAQRIIVKQLQKDQTQDGTSLRTYTLYYAFPTSVSQIDLAYDANDQIEEFTVEFQYAWWGAESADTNAATTVRGTATGGNT